MSRPVALVSGGSRGIGAAIVRRLADDGYDVAFCYRSDTIAAEKVVTDVEQAGGSALAVQVDVSDRAEVTRFVKRADRELGPLEAVVTSAGIVRDNPLVLQSADDWDDVLRVNLDGTQAVCKAAVFAMMKRRRGAIVTLSSVAGVYGNATQTNYSAAKAGIIGFTRALAKEVAPYAIRVNAVAPGFIDTDMVAGMDEARRAEATARIPLGRLGTAAEVADLTAFLVSGQAGYITGQSFGIDGGLTL